MTTLHIIRKELQRIGYAGNLLQENYTFDDVSMKKNVDRQVTLAAFANWPPSYRNACVGVVRANGNSGPDYVSSFRALGAPMFFEIYNDYVLRYKIEMDGKAVNLEKISIAAIQEAFLTNEAKWKPESVFRAKAISPVSATYQLDFIDAGLMLALKGMIHEKLDKLLKSTIYDTISSFKEIHSGKKPNDEALLRLIFRFLAAKIFKDKKHPGDWSSSDPDFIINKVQDFYGFHGEHAGRIIDDPSIQQVAWDKLRQAFNFQNLSVEDLAFIYENTLVTEESRKKYGIHSTPSIIAELMVDRLPFEDLPQADRYVLEPCAGHGVFLVAALRRLRDLLPPGMPAHQRHDYLKDRLKAIEVDSFAAEVCRLSLTLADFPNPDGWQIISRDIFAGNVLENNLIGSKIVLCNPPFEDFSEEERYLYTGRLQSVHKPYEILHRVLKNPPEILGFVLPKSSIIRGRYSKLKDNLTQCYTHIETVSLPDRVFAFSDQETMLLLASKPNPSKDANVLTRSFWVQKKEKKQFLETGVLPEALTKSSARRILLTTSKDIWNPPLFEIWDYFVNFNTLGQISEAHRGIEWNIPLKENFSKLVSYRENEGFRRGVETVNDTLEPLGIKNTVYLNMNEDYRRNNAHFLPWEKPKVVVNAHRTSTGPWRIIGFPDTSGLVFYQNFIGIWPKFGASIEVIASIINSPIANAYIFIKEWKRHNSVNTIESVPVPDYNSFDIEKIKQLVTQYQNFRHDLDGLAPYPDINHFLKRILLEIDSLILKAYDLPPRLERKLLDFFNGYPRPVPFRFSRYFPENFQPCIPLCKFLELDLKWASAGEFLKRITHYDSKQIHEFVMDIEEGQQT